MKNLFYSNQKDLSKIVILGILIQISFFLGQNFYDFKAIGLFFLLISFFLINSNQLVLLLLLLIPNQRLIVIEDGGASLLNIFFLYLYFKVLFRNKYNKKEKFIVTFFSLTLLWYGIILSSLNKDLISLQIFIKFIIVIFVLFSEFIRANNYKIRVMIIFFIIGILITSFLALASGIDFNNRFKGGDLNDTNYFGTLCSLGLSIILVVSKKINIRKVYLFILFGYLVMMGILTQSRSFMFSIVVILIAISYLQLKKNFILTIITSAIFIYFLSTTITQLHNDSLLLNNISQRILNPRNDDISGNRFEIWNYYYHTLISNERNLFFGLGKDAFLNFDVGQVAHNFLLEDFVGIGLLGVFFSYLYLSILADRFFNKNSPIIAFFPLCIFLINSFTLHSFFGMGGLTQLFICFLVVLYLNPKKNENTNRSRFCYS